MESIVKILSIEHLTHDVLRIVAEKPDKIKYTPGQAADFSINKTGWEKEIRAFTFTSLQEDEFVEFTIKTYPEHKGVTNQLLILSVGDEVIIHGVFGDIQYKGEGIFIAGGAGITPFIAIMKKLTKENKIGNNKLIFANKTKSDIIDDDKFSNLLGSNFTNVLSNEKLPNYEYGFITEEIIRKQIDNTTKYYYLCGPEPMMLAVEKQLKSIGITQEFIIQEGF